MKKFSFILAIVICSISATYAQSLEFYVHGQKIEPGTEITSNVLDLNGEAVLEGAVKNISSTDYNVKLYVESLGHTEGVDVYACWVICPMPWYFEYEPILIKAGEITSENTFSMHFAPNGIVGEAKISFRFEPIENPTAAISYTVLFRSGVANPSLSLYNNDNDEKINNGDFVSIYSPTAGEPLSFKANLQNVSSETQNVKFEAFDMGHTNNVNVIAAWGEVGTAWDFTSFDPVEIAAGETTANGVFYINYIPGSIAGNAKLYCRFSVIDELNPDAQSTDTLSFILGFQSDGNVSIPEKEIAKIQVFPNPASNKIIIKYEFDQPVQNAEITLFNILGVMVKTQQLKSSKGSDEINISDFVPGIYFYTIKMDGKVVETKKIIVAR